MAIAIIRSLDSRPKACSNKVMNFPVEALLAATEHILFEDEDDITMGGTMCCQICLAKVSLKSPLAKAFLTSKCCPPPPEFGKVIPIGNSFTHPTHQLKLYGGVYLCITCGCLARKKIGNLSSICRLPTVAGKRNLNNYIQGKAPTNCSGWPLKAQFQRPFSFVAPPGKIGCADTLVIARVLEQISAAAQFERIQLAQIAVLKNIAAVCAEDPGDDVPMTINTAPCIPPPPLNYNHGLDDPEGITFESSDGEYMEHEVPPPEFEDVFSDSD